ncbi:MAG: hypothetical protein ABIX10_15865 [Acidimicrobiales bacterium]
MEDAGIRIDMDPGWEGQIRRRTPGLAASAADRARVPPPPIGGAVVHLANFPLPAEVGDFGGGTAEQMRAPHILINLVEYDDASIGSALFAAEGLPRIAPGDFDPATMQRTIDGQSGAQRFFTAAGRPFCLYVVLGSHLRRFRTGPVVADALGRIEIAESPID